MYRKIIVPIDLSNTEKANAMIDAAKRLADEIAKIYLVNIVLEIPGYVAAQLPRGLLETNKEKAREELSLIADSANLSAEVEVRIGTPPNAILEIADEIGADMIIIASHQPGLEHFLLGSTAARVVRHAKCSVLVMR